MDSDDEYNYIVQNRGGSHRKEVIIMLMQYLPPEQRKGEHRYKQGSFVLYDGRPSKEKQEKLIAEAVKNNEPLKKCPVCGSFMNGLDRSTYCSQRCVNDAYIARRRRRHEMQLKKVCAACGAKFTAKRKDAQYCSNACKQAAYRKRNVADNRSPKFGATESGNS